MTLRENSLMTCAMCGEGSVAVSEFGSHLGRRHIGSGGSFWLCARPCVFQAVSVNEIVTHCLVTGHPGSGIRHVTPSHDKLGELLHQLTNWESNSTPPHIRRFSPEYEPPVSPPYYAPAYLPMSSHGYAHESSPEFLKEMRSEPYSEVSEIEDDSPLSLSDNQVTDMQPSSDQITDKSNRFGESRSETTNNRQITDIPPESSQRECVRPDHSPFKQIGKLNCFQCSKCHLKFRVVGTNNVPFKLSNHVFTELHAAFPDPMFRCRLCHKKFRNVYKVSAHARSHGKSGVEWAECGVKGGVVAGEVARAFPDVVQGLPSVPTAIAAALDRLNKWDMG